MTPETTERVAKPTVNWVLIEMHVRAGIRSLENIGQEYGITKGRISQVATKGEWTRDLKAKIKAKTEANLATKVAVDALKKQALNDPTKQAARRLAEKGVVDANADIHTKVILAEQADGSRHRELSRNLLSELEAITNDLPNYQKLGKLFDESGPDANGTWKKDALNDAYMKMISLAGRIDSAKKLAETHEKNINVERRVHGLEDGDGKADTVVDMLRGIDRKLRAEQAALAAAA